MFRHFGKHILILSMTPLLLKAEDIIVNTRLHQSELIDNGETFTLDLRDFFQTYASPGPVATFSFSAPKLAERRELKVGVQTNGSGGWLYNEDGSPKVDLSEDSPTVIMQTFVTKSGQPYENAYEISADDLLFENHSVQFQLLPIKTPVAVANFLTYQKDGYYEKTIVHYDSFPKEIFSPDNGLESFIGPGVIIAGRWQFHAPENESDTTLFDLIPPKEAIGYQPADSNTAGTIAMDRSTVENATSVFRINLDNSGRNIYTVFGRLIDEPTELPVLKNFANTPVYDLSDIFSFGRFDFAPLYAWDYLNRDNYLKFESVQVSEGDAAGISYAVNGVYSADEPTESETKNQDAFQYTINDGVLTVSRKELATGQIRISVTGSKEGLEDATFNIDIIGYNETAIDAFPGGLYRGAGVDTDGLLNTTWYDTINAVHYPFVWHPNHGWQFFSPSSSYPNYFIYDYALGWLYTRPTSYPDVYLFNSSEWVTYVKATGTDGSGRWFYRYSTGEWTQEGSF